MPSSPHPDLRSSLRSTVQIQKLFSGSVDLPGEDSGSIYLYIVELCESGMRINIDRRLPDHDTFQLRFLIGWGRAFDCQVRLVWQKVLTGGTWVAFVNFVSPSAEAQDTVRFLMQNFSTEGRRVRTLRKQGVPVSIRIPGNTQWWSVTTISLSSKEVNFRLDRKIERGTVLDINIFLRDMPSIQSHGQVTRQEEIAPGWWAYQAELIEVPEYAASLLEELFGKAWEQPVSVSQPT